MNRSWTTILLLVGLVGLLVVIGGLQYRWLNQISVSDGEKAHRRVQEQADRFAMDFNREIQNSYFNFQTDSETWTKKDWTAFNERYDYWHDKAAYPALITDFYFFESKNDGAALKYDWVSHAFVPVEMTPELADLRTRASNDETFKPVYEDIYTLVLPIHDTPQKVQRILLRTAMPALSVGSSQGDGESINIPPKFGYLTIKLDPNVIKDQILPDLAAKYFGESDFRAAVTDKAGQAVYQNISNGTSDASVPLFVLSPDNFIFFANKELMNLVGGERKADMVMTQKVEGHTFNRVHTNESGDGTVKIEVKTDSKPRTSVLTTNARTGNPGDSSWTLQVQHSYGSIDAFMAWTLRRNLGVGFGLLFLLACAVAGIIFSAQRAKMLAQRQVDFVSSVSHEFRTPLAVIYSAGENLADGVAKEDSQVSRYGDLIKGEGRKLTGMVEQILDFAGANSGKKKYSFANVVVGDVVNEALAECRPLIDEKGITAETNISDSLPSISADKNALSRAVQNLIANSVKYSNGNAWLRLTAENGGGNVKIAVEDRGMGISKSDLQQIFEPFFRAKSVVDAQIHGNGLGLSLVKQIVEAHGGKVSAMSEIEKGSKFTIEIPTG